MEKISLLLWTTSKCNLKCPLCCVKFIQKSIPDYEMSIEEVKHIIQSSKDRNIKYEMIHFAGGEPTIWSNLKEATELFYNSGITKNITLISNGTNPEKIFEIKHMLPCYAISATQINEKQLKLFQNSGHKVVYNFSAHKPLVTKPFDGVLPALCCNLRDYMGTPVNQIMYIDGKVYYCCSAPFLCEMTGLTSDLYCDFEDNFINKFMYKTYDKEICRYCFCNDKVWRIT